MPETCQESQAEVTGAGAGPPGPWARTGAEVEQRVLLPGHQLFALKSHCAAEPGLDFGPWGLSRAMGRKTGEDGGKMEEGPGVGPRRGKGF